MSPLIVILEKLWASCFYGTQVSSERLGLLPTNCFGYLQLFLLSYDTLLYKSTFLIHLALYLELE